MLTDPIVIVGAARTPMGGLLGDFAGMAAPQLGSVALDAAVSRARLKPEDVENVVMGCVLTQGSGAPNIGRLALLRAGLPVTVSGQTIDRQCSSGLMAIATAAKHDGCQQGRKKRWPHSSVGRNHGC